MFAVIFLIVFAWYVIQQVKFAPEADPKRPWRTLTIWFGRMSFEDKTLNDNVPYARHAISIDENRAAFARVGWGDLHSTRPDKDADGFHLHRSYRGCNCQPHRYGLNVSTLISTK